MTKDVGDGANVGDVDNSDGEDDDDDGGGDCEADVDDNGDYVVGDVVKDDGDADDRWRC